MVLSLKMQAPKIVTVSTISENHLTVAVGFFMIQIVSVLDDA